MDISLTVAEFIPIGVSFENAEAILRAAGFDVAPSPPRPIAFPGSQLTQFKILAGTTLEQGLFYKKSLSIILDPEIRGPRGQR